MSSEFNPFLTSADENRSSEDNVAVLPSNNDEHQAAEKQDLSQSKVDEKYTSLNEKATTMLRSVSIEDDMDRFLPSGYTDESDDSKDLFVKVEKPEKHVEGYVSYEVTTKTTRPQYDAPEYTVRRRYQDFLWLKAKLEETNPTHIIPPLPAKFAFSKHFDRFDPDFLKTRQKALDKFINRVAEHPVISFNEHFQVFLTAKAWEMTTARKNIGGLIDKMGGTVKNAATSLMLKDREPEFAHMIEYNKSFLQKIQSANNVAEEVAKERFYLLDDLAEYGSAFRLWSNSETQLADPLTAVAHSLDKNVDLLKALLRVQDSRVAEPLREYILYADAVKAALRKRDQIQMEYELTSEELRKKRLEKEELESSGQQRSIATFFGKDPEKVKEEKMEKLVEKIGELTCESETLADRKDKADLDLKADMERWQKNKRRDLKGLFMEMADRHVRYYEGCLNSWQDALSAMTSSGSRANAE